MNALTISFSRGHIIKYIGTMHTCNNNLKEKIESIVYNNLKEKIESIVYFGYHQINFV
jgi:hypothetical protein